MIQAYRAYENILKASNARARHRGIAVIMENHRSSDRSVPSPDKPATISLRKVRRASLEMFAIWSFAVFSFAALLFCAYIILAKCRGTSPF
jgi:hypothetical protein